MSLQLTRFPFEEVLALVRGDVRDRGEDVGTVGGAAFDAVAVVDPALAGLVVDIKVLQVVVEVDATRTEIPTEESGVGGEDCGDVERATAAQRNRDSCDAATDAMLAVIARIFPAISICTSLPLVEVSDNGAVLLVDGELGAP